HRAHKLARAQHDNLAAGRMPADMTDVHAGKDFGVTVDKLHEIVSVSKRREVVGHICRLIADVRSQRKLPLASLDEVPRLRKGQLEAAVLKSGQPARVIPV